jgi:hypothetical protein
MIIIAINKAPAQQWLLVALRTAKAAAEANEIEWEYAHIRINMPRGRSFSKLPGHLNLVAD